MATDGSAEAVLAEEAAIELAAGTGSELHVVYVVSTVPELSYPRSVAKKRCETIMESNKLRGLELLDSWVRRMEELGGASRRRTTGRGSRKRRLYGWARNSALA